MFVSDPRSLLVKDPKMVRNRDKGSPVLISAMAAANSAGVDGMTVEQLPDYLKQHGPEMKPVTSSRVPETTR